MDNYMKKIGNKDKTIKLSIILFVNKWAFLDNCLNSILEQSLNDIELICIDWNESQEAQRILNKFAIRDSRINLIKNKQSLKLTVDAAINSASSDYIHFLESCDYVLPYAYEALYNKVKKYNLDMIRFSCMDYDVRKKTFLDINTGSFSDLRVGDFNRLVGTEADSPLYKVSTAIRAGIYKKSILTNIFADIDIENPWNERIFYAEVINRSERNMISRDRLVVHQSSKNCSSNELKLQDIENAFKSFEIISNRLKLDKICIDVQERILLGEFNNFFKQICTAGSDSELAAMKPFIDGYKGSFAYALKTLYNDMLQKPNKYSPVIFKKVNPYHEMFESPKVSVIVPIYNVEDYLNEALYSLVTQTLEEIEFVCINDGSTDGSLTILNEYAAIDKRIRILDGPNGGYGKGMNRGIDVARGEYIGILEPDDFVPSEMFKELYYRAKNSELDFVKADFHRFVVNADGSLTKTTFKLSKERKYYNKILRPINEPETFKFVMNTWSGIYKLEFLRRWDIRHNETPGASYQDNGFWFQTFCRAERAMFIDKFYYMNRRDNPNSSMFSSEKMYAVTNEYKFIYDQLHSDKELWEKVESIFWAKKLENFFVTLNRLKPELQQEYVIHFYNEFKYVYDEGLLDEQLIGPAKWLRFMDIMENPEEYLSKICVSVIIAVYNSEKWLRKTLDSLLVRNEIPFEVICVDDGSTDNSLAILREYEERDFRVYVITQSNAGAGAARNNGMGYARGEYLLFLDSDDFFEPNLLRFSYDQAHTADADIVVFRSDRYWEDTGLFSGMNFTIKRYLLPKSEPFAGKDIPHNIFRAFSGYAWDKLFRADFIRKNEIRFLEQPCINDQLFTFCAILQAEKICTNDTVLVHYRRPEGALTFARDDGDKWCCYYNSLMALRGKLIEWGIFDEREQDFVNYCLYFSIWNLTTLHAPAFYKLYNKLKNEWFDAMGITDHDMDYFYDRDDWNQLQKVLMLSAEDFLFWRSEDLEEKNRRKQILVNNAHNQLSAEKRRADTSSRWLTGFISARIDLKNQGSSENDIILLQCDGKSVRTERPDWFRNSKGSGHVVKANADFEGGEGRLHIKLRCVKNGILMIQLKGMDLKNASGRRERFWMDYYSLKINGKESLNKAVRVWHDKVYEYHMDVNDGEEVDISVCFKSHAMGELITEKEMPSRKIINYNADNKDLSLLINPAESNITKLLENKTVISWGGYHYFDANIDKIKDLVNVRYICVSQQNFSYEGYSIIGPDDILKLEDPYVIISQYYYKDIYPAAKWLTEHNIPFTHLSFLLNREIYEGRFLQALGNNFIDANGNEICISNKANGKIFIEASKATNAVVTIGAVDVKGELRVKLSGNNARLSIGNRNLLSDMQIVINDNGEVTIGDDCIFKEKVTISHLDTCMLFDSNTGIRLNDFNPIRIGNHVCAGDNTEFFGGAEIGDNCVISAGTIVAQLIESNSMVAGNPAKVIKKDILWSRDSISNYNIEKLEESADKVALSYSDLNFDKQPV